MQEYSRDEFDNRSKLYAEFPFMQAFPFEEYTFTLEKEDDLTTLSGIDPVVISEAGKFVVPEFVNFYYISKETKVSLSFYTYDIRYILENSKDVKKIDEIREALDYGISATTLLDKIESIKKGEKFLKKLGSSLIVGKSFDGVLDEFLANKGYVVSKSELRKIKSKFKTISEDLYDDELKEIIGSFYDIHLHHIKILLGIVIASKIY